MKDKSYQVRRVSYKILLLVHVLKKKSVSVT